MSKTQKEIPKNSISMDLILPPQNTIRLEIPDTDLFELSESMKELGLIEPIILTPLEDKFEIVAGHRRWLAAQKLGWTEIKAEVRELTPKQVALIRATENIQRQELSPIEEAAIYQDLYDNYKLSFHQIGRGLGLSSTYIRNRLKLLKMDPKLQQAIHNGKISIAVAEQLNKITEPKDLYRYLELAIENGVTATVAAQWTEEFRKSLQYVQEGTAPPNPLQKTFEEQKFYTACELCEGPMEYKDMRTIKLCKTCYDLLLHVVQQGYFKRKED